MMDNQGIQARKMEVGETVKFTDFVITQAFTQYGESSIVSFADDKGTIIRKVFSDSLAKHLKSNPNLKQITLKKKLQDGKYSYNVWE